MADVSTSAATPTPTGNPVNVSQVKQLSPFRYPGGKTWLIPVVKEWFERMETTPDLLLESFAGGAIVGLTAARDGWAKKVKLVEKDDDVAAVWSLVIHGSDGDADTLFRRIEDFDFTTEHVREIIDGDVEDLGDRAFRTIIKNRAQRGGIMAPGAGLMKVGEAGRGVASRWYPQTLIKRMAAIRTFRDRLEFVQGDAIEAIEQHQGANTVHFIDPPYTAPDGKKAGRRLYTHNALDHDELFAAVSHAKGAALLTYDDNEWVRAQAERYGFGLATSFMQSTHGVKMHELVVLKEGDAD